jgi:predicted PurR-regulated permease PerM
MAMIAATTIATPRAAERAVMRSVRGGGSGAAARTDCTVLGPRRAAGGRTVAAVVDDRLAGPAEDVSEPGDGDGRARTQAAIAPEPPPAAAPEDGDETPAGAPGPATDEAPAPAAPTSDEAPATDETPAPVAPTSDEAPATDEAPAPTPDGAPAPAPAPAAAGTGGGGRMVVDIDAFSFVAFVVAAMVAIALFAIASSARNVLTGIGVGVLLGVALSPVVSMIERRVPSRGSAVVLVGTGLALATAGVVLLVAPAAVNQARDFSDEVPDTVRQSYSWPIIGERLENADAAGAVEDWIDNAPTRINDRTLANLGERLLGGLLSTVVVVVTALGVMVDGEFMVRRVAGLVPTANREQSTRVAHIVYDTFGSYFAGSLLVAVLAGIVILTAGLILGVPLAPVAGLWASLTNLIPQIGGFLGGGFFVLLALTQGPLTAVLALAVFLGYSNLENHVIQPAIVGRAVNLTPPATMLAALVGAAAAGVPGALVATPLLGAMKALYLDTRGQHPVEGGEVEVVRRRMSDFVRRLLAKLRRNPPGDRAGDAGAGPAAEEPVEQGHT